MKKHLTIISLVFMAFLGSQLNAQIFCNANFSSQNFGSTWWFSNSSTASGSVIGYNWSFGDGSSSTLMSPSHTYANPGTYLVCLSIFTSDSCFSSFCDTISVTNGCLAGFTFTQSGNTVSFTNTSSGNYSAVQWYFGDGNTSTQPNPTHTYASSGTYFACLELYDSAGNFCDTTCAQITVSGSGGGCNASFTSQNSGSTYFFTNTSTGNYNMITWYFGDGNTSNLNNPTHTYANSGNYWLCIILGDTNGSICDSTCSLITVANSNPNCNASFSYAQAGNLVQFSNNSSGNTASYLWTFGDGTTSTQQFPSHTYPGPGSYNACLFVYNSFGNICDSTCQTIVVQGTNPTCQAQFSYGFFGNNYWFNDQSTASPGNVNSWFWSFGDGSTSTAQYPSHNYSSAGSYVVCLSITTTDSCTSTYCDTISVSPGCFANFTYTNTSGNTYAFTNTSTGGYTSIVWNFGDGNTSTQQNPTHTYAQNGTYWVCISLGDTNGNLCDTACAIITVSGTNPTCQAQFISAAQGNTVSFIDQSTASSQIIWWWWDFGDGTTGTGQNPTHTYANPGLYLACVTIETVDSCVSVFCDSVWIQGSSCTASFTSSVSGNTASFNNTSQNASTYYWWFGDGNFSTLTSPSHTYANAGTYTVCLTSYSPNGALCDSVCQTVTIQGQPNCQAAFYTIDSSGVTYFINTSTGTAPLVSAFWDFGDGSTSTQLFPTHQYTGPGPFLACLTVYMADSCTSTTCDTLLGITSTDPGLGSLEGSLEVFPNPTKGSTTVRFTLPEGMEASISAFNVQGQLIDRVADDRHTPGMHTIEWNTASWPQGIYLLRIETDRGFLTRKLIKQ